MSVIVSGLSMQKIKCPYCDFVAYGENKERAEEILNIHIYYTHEELG